MEPDKGVDKQEPATKLEITLSTGTRLNQDELEELLNFFNNVDNYWCPPGGGRGNGYGWKRFWHEADWDIPLLITTSDSDGIGRF